MTKQEIDHAGKVCRDYMGLEEAAEKAGDAAMVEIWFARRAAIRDIMADFGYRWRGDEGFKKRDE